MNTSFVHKGTTDSGTTTFTCKDGKRTQRLLRFEDEGAKQAFLKRTAKDRNFTTIVVGDTWALLPSGDAAYRAAVNAGGSEWAY